MQTKKAMEEFKKTQVRVNHLHSATALLEWDLLTVAPPNGADSRAQALGTIETEAFTLQTSDEFGEILETLENGKDELTPTEKRMYTVAKREYDKNRKIPRELYGQWVVDRERSSTAWHHAKSANDFKSFEPHLQSMIDYMREFITLWGKPGTPYDTLLDIYEPGMLSAELDVVFSHVLRETRDMLSKIPSQQPPTPIVIPAEKQKAIGEWLLGEIGFDLKSGNLFPTEHPFTTTIHHGDVRLTTKYIENHPESSIFSVLHEGGHGLYEQNVSPALAETNLSSGASMGLHESQSRLWENIIGRSLAFWNGRIDKLSTLSGGAIAPDADAFYRRINSVRPSLIRIEADELSYNLHIIVRYEIERMIFNEGINAGELPEIWNKKYAEYLGVTPPDDTRGILQDVHWSQGSFGYFPSYSLGNLYGAQFLRTMEGELGPIEKLAGSNNGLASVLEYLRENIYKHGMLEEPSDILKRVTGKPLDPSCLTDYLRKKLGEIYGF